MIFEIDGLFGVLVVVKVVEKFGGRVEVFSYLEVMGVLRLFGVIFVRDGDVLEYLLVVVIEIFGRVVDGRYYFMSGMEIMREVFDGLVIEVREYGILIIVVGDGGNEVGMGNVRDLIELYIFFGEKIVSVVEVDYFIMVGVLNWGFYGLVVYVLILVGINFFVDWDEERVVKVLISVGLIDGVRKKFSESVDGIGFEVYKEVVEFLKVLINDVLGG